MRTRSKILGGGVVPGARCEYWLNGSFQNYEAISSPDVFKGTSSTIIDDPKGRGWKPCVHYVAAEEANTDTSCTWTGSPTSATHKGPNAYWSVWRTQPTYVALDSYSYTWPRTIEQQKSAAYAKFLNSNEVDTLLNVWEAPQLADSYASLKRTLNSPGVLRALRSGRKLGILNARDVSILSGLRKPLGQLSLRTLTSIPSNYLAWSFGIAPLLADMAKVEKAASTFVGDVKKAVSRAGEEAIVRDITLTSSVVNNLSPGGPYQLFGTAGLERTVSIKGVNSIPFNSKKLRAIDYVMKRWGSPGPASLTWERIPFSFVVDWFLDTSVLFASLDNALTGGSKRVTGMLCTTIMESESLMKHHAPGYPDSSVPDGTVVARQVSRKYDREILSGTPPLVSWKGRFGKKQLALSAALLYQQVANRL